MDIRIESIEFIEYSSTLDELHLTKEKLEELKECHLEDFKDYVVIKNTFEAKESHAVYNNDGSFSHVFIDNEMTNLKKYENLYLCNVHKLNIVYCSA